jgi:uncharacterized protein
VPAPIDLPDVNVWLAYSMEDHVHHKRAKAYWLDESADRVAFCRTTALGFLRLSTNTHVMGGAPLSAEEAWRAYTSMRRVSEIVLAAEPPDCDAAFERIVLGGKMPLRMWTDAYLAALAISAGMRLVSFDSDFERFAGLNLLLL